MILYSKKNLPKIVIKNIINILTISVKLKTHVFEADYDSDILSFYMNILGEERIKNFNYKEAERLINLLEKKLIVEQKTKPILNFSQFPNRRY